MEKISIRQNFHEEVENGLNKQINMELRASYVYQSMAYYYDRDDVSLPGFYRLYLKNSYEEREHAEMLIKYLNKRGGRWIPETIQCPDKDEWGTGLDSLTTALGLEKQVNDSLLLLHGQAFKRGDSHLTDYLESKFLTEQVEAIKELADMITQLKRTGPHLGEFEFDKFLQSKYSD